MIAELKPPPVSSTRVERDKRDAFELELTGDVRHDGAGLDGVHRATAAPSGISLRLPSENVCPLLKALSHCRAASREDSRLKE